MSATRKRALPSRGVLPTVDALYAGQVVAHGPAAEVRGDRSLLSCARPDGLSVLNILPGSVHEIRSAEGQSAIVAIDAMARRVLAHITRRSAGSFGIAPDGEIHAGVKTVSDALSDIGAGDYCG